MIVDKAGELIVDALTITPSLSGIASASAILDTSNYTIRAISFGKDASGYLNHAHEPGPRAIEATSSADRVLRVVSYEASTALYGVSSYHSAPSATSAIIKFNEISSLGVSAGTRYYLLPEAPSPMQTRLETKSTAIAPDKGLSGYDLGHNLNMLNLSSVVVGRVLGETVSGTSSFAGCYAPSSGVDWAILSSAEATATPVVTGNFKGLFNTCGTMDLFGHIGVAKDASSAHLGRTHLGPFLQQTSGLIFSAADNFSSTGRVDYATCLSGGDAGCAGLYGGIYNIGLWAFDMKAMLKKGKTPPYTFSSTAGADSFDDILSYKLFARKTFTRDITYIRDYGSSSGYFNYYGSRIESLIPNLLIKWGIYF
tara:strand:- start:12 stop:1115 length:1104 start_codon:yes stop_codon:yes gene_type:complete